MASNFSSAGLSGYYSRNYTRQLLSMHCVELRRVYPEAQTSVESKQKIDCVELESTKNSILLDISGLKKAIMMI